jgi:hypothetical protein
MTLAAVPVSLSFPPERNHSSDTAPNHSTEPESHQDALIKSS